jgi:hypothetical protein
MILSESARRNIMWSENYLPFYICSIACHIFSMVNKKAGIYTEGASVPNTRLHILMSAFPGFGKTYFLKQFLDSKKYSYVKDSGVKGLFKSGKMSEAGFVGTVSKDNEGIQHITYGFCHPDKEGDSIMGFEEFSTVTSSFKQDFNAGLDNAILTALDTGMVGKDLGGGGIAYETNLTAWAGVQPARFDLGSGFARRLVFTALYPSIADIRTLRESRRKAKNIKIDITALKNIRLGIGQKKQEITSNLKKITFSEEFYCTMDDYENMPYDDDLFERVAIGYHLMRTDRIGDQLYITMDSELSRIMKLLRKYEGMIRRAGPLEYIWNLIRSEDYVEKGTVLNYGYKLGLENNQIQGALNNIIGIKKWAKKEGEFGIRIVKKD